MTVSSLLKNKESQLFTTTKDTLVGDCITLMNQKKIGALVVVAQAGTLDGIITERDILRALSGNKGSIENLLVSEVMTPREKLITTDSKNSVANIMDVMTKNRIRHLPVMDDGKLIGIVSIGDVVKNRLEQTLVENESMKNYITGF